ALKTLPAGEQDAFGKLWADVDALLQKARPATAQTPRFPPPTKDSRNSPPIVKVFHDVVEAPSKSTVRVRCDGADAALGTIVGEDGWIVTKASQLTGKITCKIDGQEL